MKTRFSLIVVAVGSRFGGRTIRGEEGKEKKSTQHFLRGARISDQTPECWVLKKQTGNLEKSSRGCSESKTSSWRGYKCNPYSTALTLNFICDCFSIVWSTNKRQAATTTTTKKKKNQHPLLHSCSVVLLILNTTTVKHHCFSVQTTKESLQKTVSFTLKPRTHTHTHTRCYFWLFRYFSV